MADTSSQPKSAATGKGRFRRLVHIIQVLLRVFTVPTVQLSAQVQLSPRRKPSKAKHQLSLTEMAQQGTKQILAEKIQRRLQTHANDNSNTEDNHSPVAVYNQTPSTFNSVLSDRTRQLLLNSSWNRSDDEIEKATKELQCCRTFQDYPPAIQKRLCKLGWYQRVEDGRVIVREGRQPLCFYLILSGTVKFTKRRNRIEEFLQTLSDGDSFGEVSFNSDKTTSTCIAKDQVELLVISKSDYLDLSLRQTRLSYQKSKHFGFCNSVNVLKNWPLSNLEGQTGMCRVSSFKPNVVVVKDSKKSKWIYVVMTGTCRVVKRFVNHNNEFGKKIGNTYPAELQTSKLALHTGINASSSSSQKPRETLATQGKEDSPFARRKMKHAHTVGSLRQLASKPGHHLQSLPVPTRKQFLVQLQILQPKDVFGLSAIIHEDEPSVTLISNGADLVMISKDFIEHHLTEVLKMKIQRQVVQYPSEEAMKKRIRDHYAWNVYKQAMSSQIRRH